MLAVGVRLNFADRPQNQDKEIPDQIQEKDLAASTPFICANDFIEISLLLFLSPDSG